MNFFRLIGLVALGACSLSIDPVSPDSSTKVLIGSSLIDAHDLPRTQLAISGGLPACYCVSVAYLAALVIFQRIYGRSPVGGP